MFTGYFEPRLPTWERSVSLPGRARVRGFPRGGRSAAHWGRRARGAAAFAGAVLGRARCGDTSPGLGPPRGSGSVRLRGRRASGVGAAELQEGLP